MNAPKRVLVGFSGGASSAKFLLERDRPNCGTAYTFVGAFTDNPDASGMALFAQHGIEVLCLDFERWCQENGVRRTDMKARPAYFDEVSRMIERFKADIIMLSGFMLILKGDILVEYDRRILNVHPADLDVLNDDGGRKFPGKDPVRLAMKAGVTETCSCVHFVTDGVDEGDVVAKSEYLPVSGRTPEEQQEAMKWACDGPAYARALYRLCQQ